MEWVVIASGAGANIYKFTKDNKLDLIKNFENPLGRLKNKAMSYDKPGMSRAKLKGSAPHKLGYHKSKHELALDQFVRKLSRDLIKNLKQNPELQLKVVAEAKMLGKLRSYFDSLTIKKRLQWLVKDIAKVPKNRWPRLLGVRPKTKSINMASRFSI